MRSIYLHAVIVSRRDIRRLRRAADDSPMPPAVIGNCGRPADKECGMLDPSECATHAKAGWDGGDGGTGDWDGRAYKLHRLIVRAKRAALNAPTSPPAADTTAERILYVQRLRDRHGLNG
jgi:hypothetical protein